VFRLELHEPGSGEILLVCPRQEATMSSLHVQSSQDRARNARREMFKAAFFKPTAGGYVYRAPNPYVFGRGPHYIVTEGQREAILDVLAPAATTRAARLSMGLGFSLIGVLLLGLALLLLGGYATRFPGAEYAIIVLAVLLLPLSVAGLAMIYRLATLQLAELQPILANAKQTDERITNADVRWSLQTSGDRKAQRRKAIVGGIACALVTAVFAGAAALSWPKYAGGFAYGQPLFLATMAALSLVSAAAVFWQAVTPAGAGARAFNRALVWTMVGVGVVFLALTMVHAGLRFAGTIAPNYTEMFERAERNAANGDAAAMARLGWHYREGKGVAQDHTKAQAWYEKSAAAGNTNAMVSLGTMFHNGLIGARDYVKARAWFDRAASAGNAIAMDMIGFYYENGLGVGRDFAEARQWYEKAAATGYGPAQQHLGMMYFLGKGVPKDYGAARRWYEKAAADGQGASMIQLGLMSNTGLGAAKDPAAARAWFEKAVSAGNWEGMHFLAGMLDRGDGGPADHARAARLMLQAAKRAPAGSYRALEGPLTFVTPETRTALKRELARLDHYSGAIDDRWDDAARAAYYAYVKGEATARPAWRGCFSLNEVYPASAAKELAQTQVAPGFKIYPAADAKNEGLLLRETPVVSDGDLADAQAGFDAHTGEPIVTFRLNAEGARKFQSYTRDNVGRPFAIVLEGKVVSAPVIRDIVLGGAGEISANFTVAEAQRVAAKLKSGTCG
jgi:TPR repeat protein